MTLSDSMRKKTAAIIRVSAVALLSIALYGSCDDKDKTGSKNGDIDRGSDSPYTLDQSSYEEPAGANDNELVIMQATPQGDLTYAEIRKEIYVVFNHPMVPLATLEQETKGAFTVKPAVKGKYRWYGSRICSFIPDEWWAPGTSYQVKIPAGSKSLNGKKLAEDYVFEFAVPTPELSINAYPYPGRSDTINYDQAFQLNFSFPVTTADLSKHLSITCDGKKMKYRLSHAEKNVYGSYYGDYDEGRSESEKLKDFEIKNPEGSKYIQISVDGKFSCDSEVKITIREGLNSEGNIAILTNDVDFTYRAHGPLDVTLYNKADYFQDDWSMRLEFTNEVNPADVMNSIKFSPDPGIAYYPSYNSKSIYLRSWNIKPGTTYNITVMPVADIHGNRLQEKRDFAITIPDCYPEYYMDSWRSVLEAEAGHRIPVDVTGIGDFKVSVGNITIKDVQKEMKDPYNNSIFSTLDMTSLEWKTGLQKNQSAVLGYDLAPYLSQKKYGWIGLIFSADVYAGDHRAFQNRSTGQVVQSTNLAMSVKEDYWNVYAWVTSFATGAAKKGVKVSVYDTVSMIGSGVTDGNGFCLIKKKEPGIYDRAIFCAEESGGDKTFLTTSDNYIYMSSLAYYSEDAVDPVIRGQFVFDRKLYRPGDEVFFKCILTKREEGKLSPLAGEPVTLQVTDSSGKNVMEVQCTSSANGGVWGSYKIPADSPLGHYSVGIKRNSSNYSYIYDTFQVEEFRPVSFTVDIKGMKDARAGENLKLSIDGQYLFGAPMGGAPVKYSMSRSKKSVYFDRYAGYTFGDNLYWFNEETSSGTGYYSGGEGTTGAGGLYTFDVNLKPLPTEEKTSDPDKKYILNDPYDITVEATVKDVDKKSVTKTGSFSVFPGTFLIGIKPYNTYQGCKKSFRFDVVAVSNKGEKVSDKKAVVRIIRNEWKSVKTKGPDGSLQQKNTLVKKLVYTKKITLSGDPETITYTPGDPGTYTITVQDAAGGSYARAGFYAYGSEYGSWSYNNDDSITIITDKASYDPGDEARILIQSPYKKCKAIITLERESIFWQKIVELDGSGSPIIVPIKKEYLPNVYFSVMLVRPRVKLEGNVTDEERKNFEDNDLGCPRFKAGIKTITVNTKSKSAKMKVVTDKESYGPGDNIKLKIYSEPNAEIALSVADRGVLDLINYMYSDPVDAFYGSWPLGVRMFQNMTMIIRQLKYSMKGASPGGDDDGYGGEGDGGGGFDLKDEDGTRRDIRYTAYWKPDIKTNDKGYAEVEFRLPDNLTTFRIMAVVAAGDRFSEYKKEFRVRKALVVQKSVPRFIRVGDRLQIGAVVINQTGIAGDFKVTLESDLLNAPSEGKVLYLKPGEAKEALFPVTLNNKKYAGINGRIISELRSGKKGIDTSIKVKGYITATPVKMKTFTDAGFTEKNVKDRLFYEFPVLEHPIEEAFTVTGFTNDSYSEQIVFPSEKEVLPQLGGLYIQLSSTALVGLDRAFGFYKSSPYMCCEQRGSAFLLTMSAGKLLAGFSFRPPEGEGYDFGTIEKLFLGEIRDFQCADGGFRLWKKTTYGEYSNPYLTAYVLFILVNAKNNGYTVDSEVMDKAVGYIRKYLARPVKDGYSYVLETISLINYTFAMNGDRDTSLSVMLLENKKHLSTRAKGLLALSLAKQRNVKKYSDDKDIKEIVDAFKNSMEITTRKVSFRDEEPGSCDKAFYSSGSTLGVILTCFMRLDRENPLIPGIVNYIIASKEHSYWEDSHSIAFLALALAEYHALYEKSGSADLVARVLINSKEAFTHTFKPDAIDVFSGTMSFDQMYSIGSSGVMYPLEFTMNKGAGRLYYTASLQYFPVIPDVKPRDEGIEIRRMVYDLSTASDRNPYGTEVKGPLERGNIYMCRVLVVNPKPYFNAVIVDPLSSNVEIINTAFATEQQSLAKDVTGGEKEYDYWWYYSVPTIEYRDDRVVIFEDYLSAGLHEYTYLIRPIVKGESYTPAASSKLMYEPEIFGRTGSGKVSVK